VPRLTKIRARTVSYQRRAGSGAAAAARFARLAPTACTSSTRTRSLTCCSPTRRKGAARAHAGFYGCYDLPFLGSTVTGCSPGLARLFPEAEFASAARAALALSLTPENIAAESPTCAGRGGTSFERPYGLRVVAATISGTARLGRSQVAFGPSARAARGRIGAAHRGWLPKLQYPIRSGEHSQTAFAFGLIADWTQVRGDVGIARLLENRSRIYYLGDRDCALGYEPSGEDFLSPCSARPTSCAHAAACGLRELARTFPARHPAQRSGDWLSPGW